MDKFDFAILAELERDGRESIVRLANKVGLSKSPCWVRVQDLRERQVIRRFRAVVDQNALGLRLTAFIRVILESRLHEEFERAVSKHPSVLECYTTAGDADYILRIVTADVERLDRLLRHELTLLPGVQRTSSTICLKVIKEGGSVSDAATFEKSITGG